MTVDYSMEYNPNVHPSIPEYSDRNYLEPAVGYFPGLAPLLVFQEYHLYVCNPIE